MISQDIFNGTADALNFFPPGITSQLSFLMKLLAALGIAFLVYLVFLIVGAVIKFKDSRRLKSITNNVQEINNKLDLLIRKKSRR